MRNEEQAAFRPPSFRQWNLVFLLIFVGWTAVVAVSLALDIHERREYSRSMAIREASTIFNKDLALRRWVTSHGGVYVPVTEETPPNPYLHYVPERDLTSPSGRPLTLMNPAYVTRQTMEAFGKLYGIQGHITSLKPLRPANRADAWETSALRAFEAGTREVVEFTEIGGEPHLRLMRPMVTEAGCLHCHAHQGYQVGDVRGGISVSVPMATYLDKADQLIAQAAASHGLIWVLGLTGLGLGTRQLNRQILRVQNAEDELSILNGDLKAYAAELKKERDAATSYFQLSASLMVVLDDQANVVEANQKACGVFELADGEIRGRNWFELTGDMDGVEARQAAFSRFLASGVSSAECQEEQVVARSGKRHVVTWQCNRVHGDGEWASGVLLTGEDISRRVELEGALHQAQELKAVGQLAGGTAHDFNNLLQVIQVNLELTRQEIEGKKDAEKFLDTAIGAVARGAKLSQQLLSFSRKQLLHPQVLEPARLIESTVNLLGRTLGEDIEIATRIASDCPPITIDRHGFENAIINLALNARAAMPKGGRLTIESGVRKVGHEEIVIEEGSLPPGDYVEISLTDTGCGMPPEILDRAFEPFFTTKEVGQGSGLGLSMVYGFVRQSDGYVRLASEVGKGTTVQVLLPVVAAATQAAPVECATMATEKGSGTILVVEDDPDVRISVTSLLRKIGYSTYEVANGPAALEVLEEHGDIDLLFSDVVMPGGMTGFDLAHEAVRRHDHIKVLLTSGYPDRHHLKSSPVLDRDGKEFRLLRKPYSNAELGAAIRSVLRGTD
jgi:PAS domain S-box-containing protein